MKNQQFENLDLAGVNAVRGHDGAESVVPFGSEFHISTDEGSARLGELACISSKGTQVDDEPTTGPGPGQEHHIGLEFAVPVTPEEITSLK